MRGRASGVFLARSPARRRRRGAEEGARRELHRRGLQDAPDGPRPPPRAGLRGREQSRIERVAKGGFALSVRRFASAILMLGATTGCGRAELIPASAAAPPPARTTEPQDSSPKADL